MKNNISNIRSEYTQDADMSEDLMEDMMEDNDMDDYGDDKQGYGEDYDESYDCDDAVETMSDDAVVAYCLDQIEQTVNDLSHEVTASENVDLPFQYFYAELPGLSQETARDPQATRYVSTDVQDSVLATIAEIMPVFVSEELAFYLPSDEMDEEQAETESKLVNSLFFDEYDGYTIIQNSLMDCLLNRNATCKVYWDEFIEVEYESFEGIHISQIMETMANDDTIEILSQEETEPEYFNLEVRRKKITGRPVIETVPPEQVVVAREHQKPTLEDVRFCAHALFITRSGLVSRGFDKDLVDSLEISNLEQVDFSRSPSNYDIGENDDSLNPYVKVYECYAELDYDQDGIAERRKIVIAGNQLLSNEPKASVSMVGGTCTTIAHQYAGLSLFDRLKAIQDAKTPIMRSIIDGTRLAANGRTAILEGKVNIDDLIKSRTGGYVRVKQSGALEPIISNEVPPVAFETIGWLDNIRNERGGSSITAANQTQNLNNTAASAFERAMSAMELITAQNARNLAETLFRSLFVEVHNVLRLNHKGSISKKVGGQWIDATPSEWTKRTGVKMTIGVSNTERARQYNTLSEVIQLQSSLRERGSVMYDEAKAYKAISKAVMLSGIKNPDQFFVDPASEQGQAAQQQQVQQANEAQQKDEMLKQAMAKAQNDIAQAEMAKGEAALQSQQVKAENDRLNDEINRLKLLVQTDGKSKDLDYKYDELETNAALKLTQMEIDKAEDLSAQNNDNKVQIGNVNE